MDGRYCAHGTGEETETQGSQEEPASEPRVRIPSWAPPAQSRLPPGLQ